MAIMKLHPFCAFLVTIFNQNSLDVRSRLYNIYDKTSVLFSYKITGKGINFVHRRVIMG